MRTALSLFFTILLVGELFLAPGVLRAQQDQIWVSEFRVSDAGPENPDTTGINFEVRLYDAATGNLLACTSIVGCLDRGNLLAFHYVDAFFQKSDGTRLLFSEVRNLRLTLKVIEDDDGIRCSGPEVIPPDDLIGASLAFNGSELDSAKVISFGGVTHLKLGRTDLRPPSAAVKINEIEVKNISDGIGNLEVEVHIHEAGTDQFLGCSGQLNGLEPVDVSGRRYAVNARFTLDQSRQRNLSYYDVKNKNIYAVVIEDDEFPCPCPPEYGSFGLDDLITISPVFPGAELFQTKELRNLGNLTLLTMSLEGVPSRVTLLSPPNSSILNTRRLTFAWQPGSATVVEQYQFQLASDSLVTAIIKDTTTTNTGVAISALGLKQGFYWWRVRGRNANGWGVFSQRNSFVYIQPTSVESPVIAATNYSLGQNYPNPFRSAAASSAPSGGNFSTTIKYDLPQAVEVQLAIFDLTGRRVRTLVQQKQQAGRYEIAWDGRNEQGETLASGVYIYQLHAGTFVQARRMALVR